MNLFIFCVLLVALSNFNVLLTFGEKPVSDTDFNENAQKKHENGNEEDISPNFSADMEIASESDEEQITSSDSVKHFDGFLLNYFKYLKVPGHCPSNCKGPKYNAVTNLDPVFAFIKYIAKCDLTKNICKNHQSSANGITWKVSTKTSKAGKIIVVFFKDQHGNLVQAQKWIKSKKIHVHIQNKEGLFIKLSGQSLDKGPSSASSFRLFIGDKAGNHVKEFESSKKRRVKYLDVDAGEDVENSYTIQFKNLKAIGKGGWCSKCNAKKSSKISSSSSSKIGFQWVGFGPAGFGFGSPQPTRDCGCEKHEQGEELGLDFDLFKEDGGIFGFGGQTSSSSSFSSSSSGAERGFFEMFGGRGGGRRQEHHKFGHRGGWHYSHGFGFGGGGGGFADEGRSHGFGGGGGGSHGFGGGGGHEGGGGGGSHQFGFDHHYGHFGFGSHRGGGGKGYHFHGGSHGGSRHHSCSSKSSSSEASENTETVEFSETKTFSESF